MVFIRESGRIYAWEISARVAIGHCIGHQPLWGTSISHIYDSIRCKISLCYARSYNDCTTRARAVVLTIGLQLHRACSCYLIWPTYVGHATLISSLSDCTIDIAVDKSYFSDEWYNIHFHLFQRRLLKSMPLCAVYGHLSPDMYRWTASISFRQQMFLMSMLTLSAIMNFLNKPLCYVWLQFLFRRIIVQ
jgi:hypothetical protein